jgi:superfamily II DNA/RNA helicase
MEHKVYHRFEDFEMTRKLHEAILDARLERPTELQLQVIPLALEDRDVLFEARSGMGKSACFAIPFLQHWLRDRNRKSLIITPTADSVQQLGKVIGRLCPSLKARVLKFTGRDDYFYPEFHDKCPIVIVELAVAERFIKREKEYVAAVRSVGLDEIDSMLDREKELTDLLQSVNTDRQTLVCANELTEQVIEKARWFCNPNKLDKVKLSRPEANWGKDQVILRYVVVTEDDRLENLVKLLQESADKITMIVTDSDRISSTISEKLAEKEMKGHVLAYSMQLDEKQGIVTQVAEAGKGVLVGCEAALNGLNMPKVDNLISWELPSHLENYWKRVDRFVFQGQLTVTAMVDEPRAGAVRILERRLGRSMVALNEGAVSGSRGRERSDRGERRNDRNRDRNDDRGERERRPEPAKKPERHIPEHVTSKLVISSQDVPAMDSTRVIPKRFFESVSGDTSLVEKYAPEGKVKKSLGSKFVPANKKRSNKSKSQE